MAESNRIELFPYASEAFMRPLHHDSIKLVELSGIEPEFPKCEFGVLPLYITAPLVENINFSLILPRLFWRAI